MLLRGLGIDKIDKVLIFKHSFSPVFIQDILTRREKEKEKKKKKKRERDEEIIKELEFETSRKSFPDEK